MRELEVALEAEEAWWRQRSIEIWLREGDRNTRFFHTKATNRRRENTITGLTSSDGSWQTDPNEVSSIICKFYENLFSICGGEEVDAVIDVVKPKVNEEMNMKLLSPFTRDEVRVALFQMHPSKAPGPDGMNPKFFQQFWDVVGDDLVRVCLGILNREVALPNEANGTNVTLIPKVSKPKSMGDLRPISLCNVYYKIILKALANRMKLLLPQIISESQSAFVPGRLITDNLLVSAEILHRMGGWRQN